MPVGYIRTAFHSYFQELNFYTKDSEDNHELDNGRIATRFYVISLILFLSILSSYTLASYETRTITISKPSLTTYEELNIKFGSERLSCPCSQIAIDYGLFYETKAIYHPICSSMFIKKPWFNFLELFNDIISIKYDFSYNAYYQFQMIAQLCDLAQDAVNEAIDDFFTSKWISANLNSQETVKTGIEQIFIKQTFIISGAFRRSFIIARIIPTYQWVMPQQEMPSYGIYYNVSKLQIDPLSTENSPTCTCNIIPNCKTNLIISSNSTSFSIPTLLSGCNFVNTLMDSTLECFFNQTCLEIIEKSTISTYTLTLESLRYSSRFPPNTKLQGIVDDMFIESWNTKFNYTSFYYTCNPIYCSYTITVHKDISILIATIIGIFGGLNASLNLLAPRLVTFVRGKGKEIYENFRQACVRHRQITDLNVST